MAIAKYTLAVDRRNSRSNVGGDQQTADFINCTAFGKAGEFAEKYFHKGIKIAVSGRIQTGSYTNKEGQKVYTTDVIVDDQEFAESKNASAGNGGSFSGGRSFGSGSQMSSQQDMSSIGDGFMNIPDGVEDE
jgi:single-strand DNA-binding protein